MNHMNGIKVTDFDGAGVIDNVNYQKGTSQKPDISPCNYIRKMKQKLHSRIF